MKTYVYTDDYARLEVRARNAREAFHKLVGVFPEEVKTLEDMNYTDMNAEIAAEEGRPPPSPDEMDEVIVSDETAEYDQVIVTVYPKDPTVGRWEVKVEAVEEEEEG